MIIERYLLREIGLAFLGVTTLLLLIFLSGTFVRILAEVVEGTYPSSVVFGLFGYKSLSSLTIVLPLAFFLAVLLALGRLYKDSEMVVLAACGVGPERVVKSVVVLAAAIAAVVAFLAIYLTPWAEEQGHRVLDEASASAEIEGIAAGRFNQSQSGEHLLYVEEISSDRRNLEGIFVQTRDKQQVSVISAEGAHQITDAETGDSFLVLRNGYRYEGTPGRADFRVVHFEQHGVLVRERAVVASKRRRNAIPSTTLWGSGVPGDVAEMQWRFSMPLTVLVLGLLAIPLAKSSPRQGRYGKLFAGILLYIIYSNLLTVSRAWVANDSLSPVVGMWWVHGLFLAAAVSLLVRQNRLPRPRPMQGSLA